MSAPVRPWAPYALPVATGSEAADFDRRAIEAVGVPQPVLMENAGRAAAAVVQRLHPRGAVVGVVGSGNNGGDALVALRTLEAWGREVRAVVVADRPGTEPVLHDWDVHRVADDAPDDAAWEVLERAGIVLDGILGTGIHGPPRDRQARAIRAVNAAAAPVVALDVPSGVDADTGAAEGDAVEADVTVAFGWPKLGALLRDGRRLRGRLVAVEIGFPPLEGAPFGAELITPARAARHRPRRPADTHKYRVGTVLVVAGRDGMAGAAVLAAGAAARAGAGLVHVASTAANRVVLQAALPEAIFVDVDDAEALGERAGAVDALAVGPAMGTDERAADVLAGVLERSDAPAVLDADALTLLGAGRPRSLADVASGRPLLLTPHAGEMARISDAGKERIREDPLGVARDAARDLGCALLLKGLPSVVAAPGEPVLVDSVGTSDLASGGMGDVLTGVAGALLAQGLDPREAGALALHLTGRAAERAGGRAGLLPRDVVEEVPGALAEDGPGEDRLHLPFVTLDLDPAR